MANITGDDNDNILNGTSGDDTIKGLGGNDTINPGLGFDVVDGGAGLDLLVADFSANPGVGSLFFSAGTGSGTLSATGRRIDFTNIEHFNITGSSGADVLVGFAGDDILKGGAGNDTITGGGGVDKLDGGAGIDTLIDADLSSATAALTVKDDGSTVVALPTGGSVQGFEQFTNLTTGSGADQILFTGDFNNTINTGLGNDTINPGLGFDVVNGGGGTDLLVADFSANPGLGSFFFSAGTGSGTLSATGRRIDFSNIEHFNLTGSPGADTLIGFTGDDTLKAGAGNDVVTGGGGVDQLDGGAGVDILTDANFSSATAALTIKDDGSTVVALPTGANIQGFEQFANLSTGSGADQVLFTTDFNNTISTGDGNDTINPGFGFDVVNGGGGLDLLVADFSANPGVGSFFFSAGTGSGTLSATGRRIDFSNIEQFNLTGSSSADTLAGFAGNDVIKGGAGNDIITGGGGVDQLDGGAGVDTLTDADFSSATVPLTIKDDGSTAPITLPTGATIQGFEQYLNLKTGSGGDTVTFTGDADNTISTGAGNDTISPGFGNDSVDGGSGVDLLIANFSDSTLGVSYSSFNYISGSGQLSGSSRSIAFNNIERFSLTGSANDDDLRGGSGVDFLYGGAGNDTLSGNTGNDILVGGAGKDTLTGGAGADIFRLAAASDSANAAFDVVTDFSSAQGDKLDLASVYSGTFSFLGTGAFTHAAGQLHYAVSGGNAVVSGDVNGDAAPDFTIQLTGVASLQAADFVL